MMSQHSAGTELQSDNGLNMTMTLSDGEGQQDDTNLTEPTAKMMDILDIPNDVMEGIFEQLSDVEAVRLLSISKAAPSRWEGRKRVERIQEKRRLQAKVLKAW